MVFCLANLFVEKCDNSMRMVEDILVLILISAVVNPCDNSTCGSNQLCLLSATAPDGYQCTCPKKALLPENQSDCICEL